MERQNARIVFGDIKAKIHYFSKIKGLYLPKYEERRIDQDYIVGLLNNEFFTVPKDKITYKKKPLNSKLSVYHLY